MLTSKLILTSIFPVIISIFLVSLLYTHSSSRPEKLCPNERYSKLGDLPLVGDAMGPESFVFDSLGGGPYTGVSDGRIIKWDAGERRWTDFAITSRDRDGCGGLHDHDQMEHICGRPLGLRFNETNGDLYIADAYHGLLKVGPRGGLATKIVTHALGIPLAFTNSLAIGQSSGVVYFTDSSSRFQRRNHISLILSGDNTGRLMKYDAQSKEVTVLLDKLSFANGVELSANGNFLLIAETTHCRVLRYWIGTSKSGTVEVFARLPGFPDNIKRSPRGGYWVAIHSKKGKFVEWALSHPGIGDALVKHPFGMTKVQSVFAKFKGSGMAIRLGENGEPLEVFEDRAGKRWKSLSEVMEKDGELLIGSVSLPFVGKYKYKI